MKLFILIAHQVRRFIHAHRTFYIFFILAQCIAIIISLFGSATIQTILVRQEEINEHSLYYEVDLTHYYNDEDEYISVPSGQISLDDMRSAILAVLDESPLNDLENVAIYGEYDNYFCGATLYDKTPSHAPDTVSLESFTFPDQSPGDTIEFGGHRYTVSKVTGAMWTEIWFPENAIPDDMKCNMVRFNYLNPHTTSEVEEMEAILKKHFQYQSMHLPPTVDPLTAQFNATVLLCTGLMIFAVLINICYAQRFRFHLERDSLAVYRLCGCSNNTIHEICLSECILVTLLLYLFCAGLFHLLLRPLVIPWYEAAETLYTLRFYALFGVAYLVLQIILLSFPLSRFVRQDIVQAKKGTSL